MVDVKGRAMRILSRSEELVLLAVWRLHDEAYGVAIRKLIIEQTGKDWSIGAIYVPLDRLVRWGYLRDHQGEPTAERGGRGKRFYRVTKQGLGALRHIKEIHETIWASLGEGAALEKRS